MLNSVSRRWLLPAEDPCGQYFMRTVVKHMDAAHQTKEAFALFFELPWLMVRDFGISPSSACGGLD